VKEPGQLNLSPHEQHMMKWRSFFGHIDKKKGNNLSYNGHAAALVLK
jgi:hypothetical protein